MKSKTRRGFTLVELLAVVLILTVLAAIAVPLYLNTRKSSAARACTANIASIAAAESAYSTRFGTYVTTWSATYVAGAAGATPSTPGLIGAPEGLAKIPTCPLNNASYTVTAGTGGDIVIACPNAGASAAVAGHWQDTGNTSAAPWNVTLKAAGNDTANPF